MNIDFQYFSCVKGHVVPRYGTDVYIGVNRTAGGWEWDEDRVVAIPVTECAQYKREYLRAVREGSLIQREKKDHTAYLKTQEQQQEVSEKPVEKAKDKKGGSK